MNQTGEFVRVGDWRTQETEAGLLQSRFRLMVRPMTPFEMMDDAVAIYRERFAPLVRISVWIYIIPAILSLLTLFPVAYLEWQSGGIFSSEAPGAEFLGVMFLEYGSLCLIYPFFMVAPMLQSAATTAVLPYILEGKQPITLGFVWSLIKPRFWHLIANQLLAYMALTVVYVAVIAFFALSFIVLTVGIAQMGLPPTLSLILVLTLSLVITVVGLVGLAMGSVWFIILPQVIILEPNTDAISAFNRAFELVRANFKHAVVSCLLFWGLQTVVYFAVYAAVFLIIGIAVLILSFAYDLETLFLNYYFTWGQLIEVLSYLGYLLVMPAMYLTSVLLYYDLRYRREGLDIQQLLGREVEA